jgi:dephospho-CoA kinase
MNRKKSKKEPYLLGLTGGTGSGQSTVAGYLKKMGAFIISADKKGHEVYRRYPDILKDIRTVFGNTVFYASGKLNRQQLGKIVFASETELAKLNRIVHPLLVEMILEDVNRELEKGRYPLILVEGALIYELQLEHLFDGILVVFANEQTRIKRVMEREQLERQIVKNRISRQFPLLEKKQWADFVINNNRSEEDLKNATKEFYQKISQAS